MNNMNITKTIKEYLGLILIIATIVLGLVAMSINASWYDNNVTTKEMR